MSNIDPNKINKSFPVAGRDNDSSVFRNNFTGIYDNFTLAKTEIGNLQTYGIFKTTLPDQPTVDNDMGGTSIKNPTFSGVREAIKYHYTIAGPAYINFADGGVHLMDITDNASFVFQNWPDRTYAKVRVIFNMVFAKSITIAKPPAGEIYGFTKLPNSSYDSVNQRYTVQFNDTGYHIFDFSTTDAGKNLFVEDVTRNRAVVEGDLTVIGAILPQGNVLYDLGSSTQSFNNLYVSNIVLANTAAVYSGNIVADSVTADTGMFNGNVEIGGNLIVDRIPSDVRIDGNLSVYGDITFVSNSTTVANLDMIGDVNISNAVNNDQLRYDANDAKWTNLKNRISYNATIADDGSGTQTVVYLDGTALQASNGNEFGLVFERDTIYRFNTNHSSFSGLTLRFSTTPDTAVPASIHAYTANVTVHGTGGDTGAYTEIQITENTPSPLFMYVNDSVTPAVDTSLIGAGYPIQVGTGGIKVIRPNYTAKINTRIMVDSIDNAVTIKLPSDPVVGGFVQVIDLGNAGNTAGSINRNITINRNGKTINGSTNNVVLTANYASATFIGDGSGWNYVESTTVANAVLTGNVIANSITSGNITSNGAVASSTLTVNSNASISGTITTGGVSTTGNVAAGNVSVTGATSINNATVSNITVSGKTIIAQSTPANASATGTVGQIAVDSDYIYVCVSANTWKRANLSTW